MAVVVQKRSLLTYRAPCHVVYTDYRPVPLQHYIFPDGSDGIHMVVDEKGKFREDNFQKAIAALADTAAAAALLTGGQAAEKGGKRQKVKSTQQGEDSSIFKLVRMCMLRDYDPVSQPCISVAPAVWMPMLFSRKGLCTCSMHIKRALTLPL